MSEIVTIVRRLATTFEGYVGADSRAGLSVVLAEAERQHPGLLNGAGPTADGPVAGPAGGASSQ